MNTHESSGAGKASRATPTAGNSGAWPWSGGRPRRDGVPRSGGPGRGQCAEDQAGDQALHQSSPRPTDEQLLFLRQIGAEYVSVGSTPDLRTAEGFKQIIKRYADAGITVWNIGNSDVHNMPEVTLNLPGRDRKIEEYKQYLRNLGKAGIHYTTYAHMGNGIWSSGRADVRGASARVFDLASPDKKGCWIDKTWTEPALPRPGVHEGRDLGQLHPLHPQVAPVAEEAGVRIGIHPDDPPVPVLAGVPRCIFSTFEGYKRALEIANSPNVGICLCCGTWLEGGEPDHRQGPRGDDPPLRRAEDLEDPLPQRQRAVAALRRDLHR